LNKLGLHARPAAEFVRCVRMFKSSIKLRKGGEIYSGASILDVLSANLDCGAKVVVVAEGSDAAAALERIEQLFEHFRTQEDG